MRVFLDCFALLAMTIRGDSSNTEVAYSVASNARRAIGT